MNQEQTERLFCVALLQSLDVEQVVKVLTVYVEKIKPNRAAIFKQLEQQKGTNV